MRISHVAYLFSMLPDMALQVLHTDLQGSHLVILADGSTQAENARDVLTYLFDWGSSSAGRSFWGRHSRNLLWIMPATTSSISSGFVGDTLSTSGAAITTSSLLVNRRIIP